MELKKTQKDLDIEYYKSIELVENKLKENKFKDIVEKVFEGKQEWHRCNECGKSCKKQYLKCYNCSKNTINKTIKPKVIDTTYLFN